MRNELPSTLTPTLDHLPPGQGKILYLGQRVNVLAAGARQRLLGDPALRASIDQPQARRLRRAQQYVLKHAEMRNEVELLMNEGEAGFFAEGAEAGDGAGADCVMLPECFLEGVEASLGCCGALTSAAI